MEVITCVCFVVIALCMPGLLILVFSAWKEIPDAVKQLRGMEPSIYRASCHLSHISEYLRSIDNSIGTMMEEPTKLSILLLKDAFLSRKDRDEGIMLVEAVEKQLNKKCRKAPQHPVG